MRWISIFFFSTIALQAHSQELVEVKIPSSKSKIFKQALKAIDLQDYFLAKRYFDALLEKGIENDNQKFEYAKLLIKLGENKKALKLIKELIKDKFDHPLVFYYAANLFNSEKDLKKARDYALFFLKKKGMSAEYKTEHTHMANLKMYLDSFGGRASDTITSRVYSLEGAVNSSGAEFNPIITNDGILFGSQDMNTVNFYKSTKLEKSKITATRAIYSSKGSKEVFTEIGNFPVETPDMEISSFAYSLDKRVLYLSGCRYTEELKRYKCDIYQSKLKGNTWTKPEIIPELTTPESSNTHITVGFDAVRNSPFIFFASDREGGRGGYDIYMSFYNQRLLTFSTPRNLGGKINTPKDDITPHYHTATNTLYFSSNGRGGKGGHDVYFSTLKSSIFDRVETLGEEINSPQDDVFFTPNKSVSEGYLVSNRYSENSLINPHCCDDIFFFEMTSIQRNKNLGKIKIQAINKKTREIIPGFSYQLFKIDSNDLSFIENGVGQDTAIVKDLLVKKNYELEVTAPKFYRKKAMIEVKNDSLYIVEFELEPIDYNPILLPLVEFEFDSFTLTSEARRIIDSLVVPVLVANPTLKIELSAHTDSRGTDEYNESLSQKRAEAIRFYLIDNKKIYPERLTSKGYGEYVPVASNENVDGTDNPEGRQRNRRCEFRILHEEYDPY
jgi:outer membrane protein OmpA-like peptidoglycan-associated protein/tetratricopeptide (TPR) repeat protein